MKPAIVVVYSRTGHTRRVGAEIASRLGCTLAEIREPRARQGLLGALRSGYEAVFARTPAIEPLRENLRDFGVVAVGTPVWAGRVSAPVRSFLRRYRGDIGALAAFCTMGGHDAANTFGNIEAITGKPPVAVLALAETEIGESQAKLDAFVDSVRAAGEAA